MFNKRFNLPKELLEIPFGIRKQVLFSLAGSVNASVISLADNVIRQLINEGYNVSSMNSDADNVPEIDQIKLLIDDPDTSGARLRECQLLNQFGIDLRDKLASMTDTAHLPNAEQAGGLVSTLKMMTGQQSKRPINSAAERIFASVGVTITKEEIEAARTMQQGKDQLTADARSARVGAIEFIIDRVFPYDFDADDAYPKDEHMEQAGELAGDHVWARLPEERRELLTAKLIQALNNAQSKAKQNVILGVQTAPGRDLLGAGDYVIMSSIIADLQAKAYPKVVANKNKVTKRVDKDGNPISTTQAKKNKRATTAKRAIGKRVAPKRRVKKQKAAKIPSRAVTEAEAFFTPPSEPAV